MAGGEALTNLSETDLKRLLSALHKGDLACPIIPKHLAIAGLSYLQDRVDWLQGLDEAAVRAVLVAVLAERGKAKAARA